MDVLAKADKWVKLFSISLLIIYPIFFVIWNIQSPSESARPSSLPYESAKHPIIPFSIFYFSLVLTTIWFLTVSLASKRLLDKEFGRLLLFPLLFTSLIVLPTPLYLMILCIIPVVGWPLLFISIYYFISRPNYLGKHKQ